MGDSEDIFSPGEDPRNELIVCLHGFRRANERLRAVQAVIRDAQRGADIFAPKLPVSRSLFCFEKAESIVAKLVRKIDNKVTERERAGGKYESIKLVGHSFGAVLARKIAIIAFGEQRDKDGNRPVPFEQEFADFLERREWAGRIRRIVLLAGLNRGWSVSARMGWLDTISWSALQSSTPPIAAS